MTDYTLEIFDPGEARTRMRQASEIVNSRIEELARASKDAAAAESVYRIELGAAVARYRTEGMGVEESSIAARAEVAVHSVARDETAGQVKVVTEKVTAALDARRSLWRLVEWSMRATTASANADERAPAAWPR